jgi:hypothetical protein
MSRRIEEPRIYKHERLMHDFNEMQIRIKTHLFNLGDNEMKRRHPKPTNDELNEISNRIMSALRESSTPMRKY